MLPDSIMMAVYLIGGCATILLVVLLVRRALGKRGHREDVNPEAETALQMGHSARLKGGNSSPAESPKPVLSGQRNSKVSWSDRTLFNRQSRDADRDLPEVGPHDMPYANGRDYVFGRLTPVLASLFPESKARTESLKNSLRTAGFYHPHAWHNLAAYRYVAIMSAIIIFGGLLVVVPPRIEIVMVGGMVIMALLGWSLPYLYVTSRAAERTSRIERAMPDMIDMLNMCVSQGLTVQDSLRRVSRHMTAVSPDLAQELRIVAEQTEVGTLEHALKNFARRIDVPEVNSFTSLLIQTQAMGTSVSTALREYSDNMRETLRQRADEKANSAMFKLLFPTALCLMPAVFLFLLGPAIIEFSEFFYGDGRQLLDNGHEALEQLR
jgi:tight adherence protein C